MRTAILSFKCTISSPWKDCPFKTTRSEREKNYATTVPQKKNRILLLIPVQSIETLERVQKRAVVHKI
jgi:hypothetical protein